MWRPDKTFLRTAYDERSDVRFAAVVLITGPMSGSDQTSCKKPSMSNSRFPSNPLITRVPFFLLFSFNNKETPQIKKRGKSVPMRYLHFFSPGS